MNILAISPHPDDIEYSISGILLKIRNRIKNANITVAYNTKYDLSDRGLSNSYEIRKLESQMACRKLAAKYMEYSLDDDLTKTAELILHVAPDIVFLPYIDDYNCIHREVTANFIKSIEVARKINTSKENIIKQLLYYEAYSCQNFNADLIIDVSEVFAEARKVLYCHKIGIESLKSLPYKFNLNHQLNGLNCAMPYGEGLMLDKSNQYRWSSNFKFFIEFLYKLTHIDTID